MSKEIFNSNRIFTLFHFGVGHGQLLLRSDKRAGYDFNVDIVFYDTTYIQLFSRLNGLSIKLLNKNANPINYSLVGKYLSYAENNLFEIESEGEKYYIAAAFFMVLENTLTLYDFIEDIPFLKKSKVLLHSKDYL